MTKNLYRLRIVLLVLCSAIALWFSGNAIISIWNYALLSAKTTAEVSKWQVRELSSSRFVLEADYNYVVKGAIYSGHTVFEMPQFLNRYSAENYITGLGAKRWQAWHVANNPSYSSMEREFPQKKCLQALLTIGVVVYFYFARNMISSWSLD